MWQQFHWDHRGNSSQAPSESIKNILITILKKYNFDNEAVYLYYFEAIGEGVYGISEIDPSFAFVLP